jgi:exodeoxyribonuclease VII large subunit
MNEEVTLSVSQYIGVMNEVLKASQGQGLWVQGEIEGLNTRGKHTYFNIVERGDGGSAALNVAIWEFNMRKMRPLMEQHRLELANGIKVRLFGSGDLYLERGSFSFKASKIDPRFTLGDLAGLRDEIIQRLKKNGLYDANRRLELPLVPMKLALVTSVGSAAHADTLHELTESGIGFDVRVVDARVQGDDAVQSLVAGLRTADSMDDVDVILLVRGGGSRTDLLTFDAEAVAAAIAACRKPVFTGIGHEVDVSIADEVAHRAFKTPTACAAHVVELVRGFIDSTESSWSQIATRSLTRLQAAEHHLVLTAERIRQRPREVLRAADQHLAHAAARLRLLDPVNTMKRGWSIVRAADGSVVRSVRGVKAKIGLSIQVSDGVVLADVTDVQVSSSGNGE